MDSKDIQIGKEYRGKTPYIRTVLWINPERTQVQYYSDSIGIKRSYLTVSMEKFAKWAIEERECLDEN